MKKNLLIATTIIAFNLFGAAAIASENILDQMETYAEPICSETYPTGIPKCTPEDIRSFRASLRVESLPLQLQEYWMRFGHLSIPYHQIIRPHFYPSDSMEIILTAWKNGVPKGWISFCSEDLNNYCINLETGKVRYWDFHLLDFSDNPQDQWGSFFDWIKNDWLVLIKGPQNTSQY